MDIDIWGRISAPLHRMKEASFRKKLIFLMLFALVVYGSLIAVDNLVLRTSLEDIVGPPPDIGFYRNRTQAVMDGLIPYKDFYCESPPIIIYLMVPAQAMGGEIWQYQAWFSFFGFLTALVIYLSFRRFDDHLAFLAALAFMVSPFGVVESTFGVEDESIAIFIFLLPLLLMVLGKYLSTAVANTIGIWTKMFNAVLFPVIVLRTPRGRERWKQIGVLVGMSAAVAIPFLIIAPQQFIDFPAYYLLRALEDQAGGISFWHFLYMGGLQIPGIVAAVVTVAAILYSYRYVLVKELPFWQACLVVLLAFFIFYPKQLLGYYLMPIALLLIWGVEDRRIMWRCFLLYIPLFLATGFGDNYQGHPFFDVEWGWMVGFALSILATYILYDMVRLALEKRPFIQRDDDLP